MIKAAKIYVELHTLQLRLLSLFAHLKDWESQDVEAADYRADVRLMLCKVARVVAEAQELFTELASSELAPLTTDAQAVENANAMSRDLRIVLAWDTLYQLIRDLAPNVDVTEEELAVVDHVRDRLVSYAECVLAVDRPIDHCAVAVDIMRELSGAAIDPT